MLLDIFMSRGHGSGFLQNQQSRGSLVLGQERSRLIASHDTSILLVIEMGRDVVHFRDSGASVTEL